MSHCAEIPLLLPCGDNTLAASLHLPARPRRTALMLPPLAEERKACQRVLCSLARLLAQQDTAVLRLDYRGTADSGGEFENSSCADWLQDAAAARAWLLHHFDNLPPALVGIRLGATLATLLPEPCGALVLIEPVSGRELLRQLLQRNQVNQMIAFGRAGTTRAAIEEAWRGGRAADLDGYLFSARLAGDLAAIEPAAPQGPGVVITTSAAPPPFAAGLEHHHLRLPAFWNAVGHIDLSVLTETAAAAVARLVPPRDAPGAATPAQLAASLPQPDAARHGGGPVAIAAPHGTLRAWLDLPAGQPRRRVLFLHGWSGDRTGPHRMFTKLGRRLAAAGALALRIDLAGRGESETPNADASIAAMTRDAAAALQWLRERHHDAGPLAIIAICSGCKVAISAAAACDDIAAMALWSAESMGSLRSAATGWRKTAAAVKTYALKLLRRDAWRKILTGRVQGAMVARALAGTETRSAAEAAAEDITLRRFRQFRGRLLFVFGGADPDARGSSAAYRAFCRRHGLAYELHTVPNAGHSFYNLRWEEQVFQMTLPFLLPDTPHTALEPAP